ncbi:unnamed protein product, partial [Sphacelaria rigidula]
RIFEYVNSTVGLGITYERGSSEELLTYADVDYVNFDGRCSVSGGAIIVCGVVVDNFV